MATLASYVPAFQIQRVRARRGPPASPTAEDRHAALLFVDVAGFTQLTESLSQRGAVGAEQLSQALNRYFGRLTAIVHAHGGDVVLFAGDAVLAVWPGSSPALTRETTAATACALAIRDTLGNWSPAEGITLRQRAAVGAGPLSIMELGGLAGAWHVLVAGDAVRQATAGDGHAAVGDVVLSPEAWAQVASTCEGDALPGGHARVRSAPAVPPAEPPSPPAAPELDALLHPYVPPAVRERLAAGHEEWIAEFRRVSVLFVTLDAIDYADSRTLDRLQRAVRAMQETLDRFEGSVYQFLMDDKGTTLVGAFGLPPLATEHGAARATEAALEIHRTLGAHGVPCSIGIATGDAFCGVVGGEGRRQYAIVGPVINLAARLMQAASGAILCDDATAGAARARVTLEALPAIRVKGKAEPVPVHRPLERAAPRPAPRRALIGRTAERAALGSRLAALREGHGAFVWIEGEAGIGKSHLMADLTAQAAAAGVRVLAGAGDAVERATAYYAWRDVLARLLTPAGGRDPAALRAALEARLAGDAARRDRAPLLNALLPLGLPETAVSRRIEGEARAEGVADLVVHLLHQAASTQATLLVVDDLHWCDSATWQLLSAVRHRVPALLVVVATRPPEDPIPIALTRLRDDAAPRLPLAPLAVDDLPALIAQRFGVDAVPDELVRFILERAEGHPFYSEEMALALLDAGVIAVADGACRIVAGPGGLRGIDFPSSVQGVITSRIDRLPPHEQLLVKAASVIGRVFAHRTLHDIYPVPEDRPRLRAGLDHLAHLDLTRLERPEPELAYVFKHAITQEVAYGSLLFAQRRQLHRAVAQWYEAAEPDTATLAPLLAHHWEKAEEPLRAVDYLEQAGAQAVRSFANREATAFLERALALDRATGARAGHARLAHWERLLGEARIHLSDYNVADAHLRRAIALSGRPAARGRAPVALALGGQVLRQLAHRLLPGALVGRAPAARRADLERAAAAHKRLAEVAWFNDRLVPMLYGIFTSLNLAERAGARRETADGYCSMGVVTGLVGLRGAARWYLDRAAALVGDEPTTIDLARTTVVFGNGAGDWERVEREATRGCEAYARTGNRFMWEACRGGLGFMHLHRGGFAEALACFAEVHASARHGALQSRLWARAGHCAVQLQTTGRVDAEIVAGYEADLRQNAHHLDALVGEGTLALAALRGGDIAAALTRARAALALLRRSRPTVYYALWGLAGVCEVFLSTQRAEDRAARQACTALDRFALLVPTARPRAALMAGRALWAAGHRRRARARWRRGVRVAERLGLAYDGALLRLELALHLPPGNERERGLGLAAAELAGLGATHDAKRAATEAHS